MYKVNVISIKIQIEIIEELEELILKFLKYTRQSKDPETARILLNQKNMFERDLP